MDFMRVTEGVGTLARPSGNQVDAGSGGLFLENGNGVNSEEPKSRAGQAAPRGVLLPVSGVA